MVLEKQEFTLDALLNLGEDARVEIVDWELIDKIASGMSHQVTAMNILRILDNYIQAHDIGMVMPDQMTYLMNSSARGIKNAFVPDVSYFSHQSVPENWDIEKPHPGVPDLAVEIISPNDNAEIVKTKVKIYLEKGTQEVWLVYPKTKEVEQYTQAKLDFIRNYQGSSQLDTDALFPNIDGLTTDAIFKLPKWSVKDED